MQTLGNQVALFPDRHFALAGAKAQVFNGSAEQKAQRFEQTLLARVKCLGLAEVEIEEAQMHLLRIDMKHGYRGEAFAVTFKFVRLVHLAQVVDDGHLAQRRVAAQAVAHLDAMLGCDQLRRNALVDHHMQVIAAGVKHPYRATVCLEILADSRQQTLTQRRQSLRMLQKS